MGGNIFDTNKRVASPEAFYALYEKQKEYLSDITDTVLLPYQIDSKKTFGDQDLLLPLDTKEAVIAKLKEDGIVYSPDPEDESILYNPNSNVVSYQSNFHQIDLIFIPEDRLDYALNYFSYGDHGNVLGRLLKHLGFKHGFTGLYHVYRYKKHYKEEILLSTDYFEVFDILKIPPEPFQEGFKTEKDVFEWVTLSPYFVPDIYSFETMTHKQRVRDRKRKFYNSFLKYLKEDYVHKEPAEFEGYFFPHLDDEILRIDRIVLEKQRIKDRYNGSVVGGYVNLSGKELGKFMSEFKKSHWEEIKNLDEKSLEILIKDFFNKEYNK